jgi:DNA-binding GntR family transcriptional regulator
MPNDAPPAPEATNPTKYKRLATTLREQIGDGTYEPGNPVPSITELSRDLGWARATCSKALQLLTDEELLTRYNGLGYYVTQRPPVNLNEQAEAGR